MYLYFLRMLIKYQRLNGNPTQMGGMTTVIPKPLESFPRNKLKPFQHSRNQKAPALRCFFVPWVSLTQKEPALLW